MWYTTARKGLSPFRYGQLLVILTFSTGALALVTPLLNGSPRFVADDDNHWVATWTSMPQEVEQSNLPPSPFGGGSTMFKDATLRQTLHMSLGASRIRVQFSNAFSGSDLSITEASIALPTASKIGVNGIDTTTLAGLTFKGSSSVVIPRGQVVYSDAIDFLIEPQSMLTVNMYLQGGQPSNKITGHPGSRTTSWMQLGNHLNGTTVTGSNTKHWYFVSVVEAWAPKNRTALVIMGDSITDGRGSDDDKNNRWTDLLVARMQLSGITNVAVDNQAAGGNAVLSGGLGPYLLSRYKRDGLEQQGVKYVMIFEGVNDIGSGGGNVGDQLINAYKKIIADCKAAGLVTIGGTITPFGGNSYSSGAHEQARQKVNQWILAAGNFDYAVDFAAMVGQGSNLKSQFDSGDHLHPNVAGYQEIANRFPLNIFNIPFPVFFTELAATYAKQTGNSMQDLFAASIHNITDILPMISDSRIHDNAAGPGTATVALLKTIPAASLSTIKIQVTDNIPAMVTAAREASSSLIPSTIKVQEMDSLVLAIPDNYISHSILKFSIFTMADPLRCFQEIYRTLEIGGVAALLAWKRLGAGEVMRAAQRVVRPDLPPIAIPHEEFMQEGILAQMTVAAGFEQDNLSIRRKKTIVAGERLADLRLLFAGILSEPAKNLWSDEERARWPEAIESAVEAEMEAYGGVLVETWVVLAKKYVK